MAWLRVYEPLHSFSQDNQINWAQLDERRATKSDEQITALQRVISGEIFQASRDGAHLIVKEGKKYIAPWSTAKRSLDSLEEFKGSLPSSVIPFFLPNLDEIDNPLFSSENRSPHILSTTWMIPPRWFALFLPEDRLVGNSGDQPFVLLRTMLAKAVQRCLNNHQIVQKAFGSGPVEQELAELLNWLNLFHPKSILECDYGGLALYLEKSLQSQGASGLEADTSIEDVQDSLQGLATGDGAQAGEAYSRLISRWRQVAVFEQAT